MSKQVSSVHRWFAGIGVAIIGIVLPAIAHAQDVSYVDLYKNNSYEQTGNGNTLSYNGSFFASRLYPNTAGLTSATVSYPGAGSPAAMTASTGYYILQSGFFPSQAAMDAAYPTGTYSYTVTGGSGGSPASFNYSGDAYSTTLPYLTGSTYSDLQGMNVHAPFDFAISSFVPATSNFSYVFLTVYDQTLNQTVFTSGFNPAGTTDIIMPANTLAPGDSFTYEIDFSDRVLVPGQNMVFDAQVGSDVRTDGNFTTSMATPEPASWLIFGTIIAIGNGAVYLARRRRSTA